MKPFLTALLLLLAVPLQALELVAPTAPVKPSALVTIPIRDLSAIDQSRVEIDWSPKAGVTVIPASWGGQSFLILQATEPGEVKITATVNGWTRGIATAAEHIANYNYPIEADKRAKWLEVTKEILAGNPFSEVTAIVTVEGKKPDVVVPPPPVVSGKRTIVLLRETSKSTTDEARLAISMQESATSKEWKKSGHTVAVIDRDMPVAAGWKNFANGKCPALLILDESGKLLYCGDVPISVGDIDAQLKLTGG